VRKTVIKILELNTFGYVATPSSNVTLKQAKIEDTETLHDFHVLVIDTAEILNPSWCARFTNSKFYI
jgi:hypothetical protein